MADNKPTPTLAGNGSKTHRQPTVEELKKHNEESPKILKAIQQSHAKTMRKVKSMQTQPIYVDRG